MIVDHHSFFHVYLLNCSSTMNDGELIHYSSFDTDDDTNADMIYSLVLSELDCLVLSWCHRWDYYSFEAAYIFMITNNITKE